MTESERLLAACEAHNEMLMLRLKRAEAQLEAIGAGGVSLMGEDRRDAERWRHWLPRVRMMITSHGVTFYIRAGAIDPAKDCSVAEHFTAAIDAAGEL